MRLVIDTDPGVDDALAIMMAQAHPGCTVEALTIVGGNVGLDHTVRNACFLKDVLKGDFPIYPGCGKALCWQPENAAFVHGEDGFGDVLKGQPESTPDNEHGASAIVRLAKENPGQLTLLTIGPLTNVALALRLEPNLPNLYQRMVVMGGAVTGKGNVSNVCAEFNIYTDPEAAHMVFSEWPQFELADWEATMAHQFEFAALDQWLAGQSPVAELYQKISGKVRQFVTASEPENPKMRAADALAMAVTLEPQHVVQSVDRHVAVETAPGMTRGMTVVDWSERLGKQANARIALAFDQARFEALIQQGLSAR